MITSGFDARVKVQQIIENQLPEFVLSESPKAVDFLKQYYISQEFQGGPIDIAENLDQYLSFNNMTQDVVAGITSLTSAITTTDTTIPVTTTKGFPKEYGLFKVDDEIITYTGITTNSFTGCIRGFSGITSYRDPVKSEELIFSSSTAISHSNSKPVDNLSALFLKEFYKKLKSLLAPGFEGVDFVNDLDINNFIKQIRNFYQAKGTNESFRILFEVLYGYTPKVINLEDFLIKSSGAEFIRREVLVCERLTGDPNMLVGQMINNVDNTAAGPVSEVELITRNRKTYYKIQLFSGFDERSLIQGNFEISPKSLATEYVSIGASVITVDSTIGFSTAGKVQSGINTSISYTDKSINQFFGCSGVVAGISTSDSILSTDYIYGYENGDSNKMVTLRITGVLSDIKNKDTFTLLEKDDLIAVKNVGEKILNKNRNNKEYAFNTWIYNLRTRYEIKSFSGNTVYLHEIPDKSSLRVNDVVDILNRNSEGIVNGSATVTSINGNIVQINQNITIASNTELSIRKRYDYASSTETPLTVPTVLANVQNTYNEDDKHMYVASNSLPKYQVTTKKSYADLSITPSTNLNNIFQGYDILTDRYNDLVFANDVPFLSGDVVVYSGSVDPIVGLTFDKAYYIEVIEDSPSPGDRKKVRLFDARSFIGDSDNCVKFSKYSGTSTHTLTLQRHYGRSLAPKKSLAKFPLETNIKSGTDEPTPVGSIGMMINGVEVVNYKSLDRLYYGPLSNVRILNTGTDYDVINPPKIVVSNSTVGIGTTALVTAVVKGSVKEILVDPQDFSISRVLSATISGGNGIGAQLEPVLSKVNREVEFNASLVGVALTGGIDATAETIAFTKNHRFLEGQPIVYNPAGNQPIGIGTFKGSNTDQNDYLVSGSIYYPKIINPRAIYLFKKLEDYNSGINTVGFTTINTGGVHKFREYEARNVISEIKVIKPGEGYENRSLNVKPAGISTTFDSITFNNHGFKDGDLINYSYETSPIVGLTTESQYYILKNDNNSFQLADVGNTEQHLGSVRFDGTSDSFDFAPAGEFAFGPDDFTIEFWLKTSSSSADGSKNRTILMLDGPTGDGARQFKLNINPVTRGINVAIETGLLSFNGSRKIDDNIWHHIAVTRAGDTLRLFVDGLLDASSNYTDNIGSTLNGGSPRLRIGSWDGNNGDLEGWISNFRIIRGSARYVHNFTVSTKPLEIVEDTILLFCKDARSETSYDITPSSITDNDTGASNESPFVYGDGTAKYNYNRKNFVKLGSSGTGYQTFSYPPITIDVLADVIGGIGTVTATPLIRGEIIDAYLYEKGTGYGSEILNFHRTPSITIKTGTGAQLKPIVVGGKVIAVEVQNGGKNFDAAPDLVVKGKGTGARLRAVVSGGRIREIIILNKGTNYEDKNTSIFIKAVGRNCVIDSSVRHLTVNNYKRFGDEVLQESGNNLGYGVVGYSTAREGIAFDDSTTTAAHSKVIGWAYDGNPIYGPFGYSDPNDINSSIRKLDTGYSVSASNVDNRPPTSNFGEGFFIEDHKFDNTGDLDIHNGRFTKTPEYVNGIYAYHVGVQTDLSTGNLVPEFPYFIGDTFRSNQTVNILDQSFDFNNSSLVRNTFPYRVSQTHSGNDFVSESNEGYNQFSIIESAAKGSIDSIKIVNPGTKYRVGNSVIFENSNTGGGGATAEVFELDGHKVHSIETTSQIFDNSVIVWESQDKVRVYTHHNATHSPQYHSLTDKDDISLSGINTTVIPGLIKSHTIGVASERSSLIDDIPANVGFYTDVYVASIPPTVGAGSTIGIGTERFMVLNRFDDEKVLRVEREVPGIAHTGGDTVEFYADSFTIPLETPFFESSKDDLIYFNPRDAIGIGTTTGNSYPREFYIGKTLKNVSVQHQSIYIPDHPFETNQAVTLNMAAFNLTGQAAARIPVRNTPDSANFELPESGTSQVVYIINKSKDFIGIVTQVGLTTSTDGLYFHSDGSNAPKYSLLSDNKQVTGSSKKIRTKVAITTEHNLDNGDRIELIVNPNETLGIGNSTSVYLKYNEEYQRILVNPVGFSSLAINSSTESNSNRFNITGHGFKTGDKVFYSANETAAGVSTGSYYVYRVDDNIFQITNTYRDATNEPPIVVSIGGTGGTAHEIGYINPQLIVRRDNDLVFNLSDSSLSGYRFKLFYDNALSNEFVSTGTTSVFSLVKTSDPGSTGAQLTITYADTLPTKLYYSLEKGNKVITSDIDVLDYSQILYSDSLYDGKYNVFGVGRTDFYITLDEVPEKVGYAYSDCSTLQYKTTSKTAFGPISKFSIISGGSNYIKLPSISGLTTATAVDLGSNAIVKPESKSIGQLNDFRILNEGFEYSADKTLSPEADVNTYLGLQSSEKVSSVDVIDGGRNYISPPDLILVNEYTRKKIDNGSIQVKARSNITENTINEVEIIEAPKGLDSVAHRLYAVNNSNGIQVVRVKTYDRENGIVELELNTPAINGFINPPFEAGDAIFVEGIGKKAYTDSLGNVTSPGNGFNSADNGYNFFTVTEYTNSNPAILKYYIGDNTDDAGDILAAETTFTSVVKSTNYPSFKIVTVPSYFYDEEFLEINGDITDLKVNVVDAKYLKVTGEYEIKIGDKILGAVSGNTAIIDDVRRYSNRFVINYANKKRFGWKDSVGKLNDDLQVIPDNNYYQNLSYTVKSPVTWVTMKDSVNKLVHPTGMKNFADTEVISKSKVGVGVSQSLSPVLDFISYRRVDTINNYDLVFDYNPTGGGLGGAGGSSRFISFKSRKLSDYINCQTNRVLQIDDISGLFSSAEQNKQTWVDVAEYPITDFYSKFLVQVSDTDKISSQLSEVVVLNDYNDTFTNNKLQLYTDKELGKFTTQFGDVGDPVLRFTPDDPNNYSYDIKVYKESFNPGWFNIGVGYTDVGFARLNSKTERVSSGLSTSVFQVLTSQFDSFYAHAHITDESNNRQNYYEVAGFYDGTDTHITETYFDTAAYTGISTGFIGTFGASVSGGVLKLDYNSGTNNSVLVKTKVIGIGSTAHNGGTGIGTYRFLVGGQADGTERTTRLESNWKEIAGITTVFNLNSSLEFSVKSIIKVGAGVTAAIHNLWVVVDQTTQNISQSYFLTQGSTTGIGTFSLERTGTDVAVKFHPDTAYANSGVTVQAYNQYIYADVDQYNKPNAFDYGTALEKISNSFYGSINDYGKDKKNFDLNYKNVPIFEKTFNPSYSNVLNTSTGLFSINDHFFETGEELIYTADTTLIGTAATSVGIGTTIVGGATFTGDLITGFSTITGIANTTGLRVGDFVYGQNIPANTTITGIGTANTYFIGNVAAASSVITGIGNTTMFTVGAGIYSGNNVGLGTIVSIGINSITSTENIADAGTDRVWYSTNSNWAVTASNVSTGTTIRQAYTTGISTDIMPKKVYSIKIGKNSFKLTGTLGLDGNVGTAFTYTSVGVGNRHKLEMKKKNSKTLITIDGVTQYPIAYTPLEYTLANNSPTIGAAVTYMSLSGISSIKPRDILKINQEYLEISNVGLGTTAAGPITGIGTVPVIHVERGFVGTAATDHTDGTSARIYKGAYNIVANQIWFTQAPDGTGNNNQLNSSALSKPNSTFNGRVYLRQDYTNNKIYDDISLDFNGIGQTFTVYKEGQNTTGVEAGSDFVFINDVFQTPNTINNAGNNYAYESSGSGITGITSVTFTGITKTGTDEIMIVDSDINQNQLPRGGVIVSLGNTGGQGYAPLVGASVTATLNSSGAITAIGIGTTGSFGSGYRGKIGFGLTDVAYEHKFVSADTDSVAVTTWQGTKLTPTDAAYESFSGLLTLTFGSNHNLTTSNTIGIATESLTFTCSRDKHDSNHAYPRETDPIHDITTVAIASTTLKTITVGVGSGGGAGTGAIIEASVGARHKHNYVTAASNAVYRGGNYTHAFVSAVPGGISVTGIGTTSATAATYNAVTGNLVLTVNQHNLVAGSNTVKIAKESLTFTCSKDNNATQHSYPRLTDPAYNSTLAIGATTLNTLTVNVGASPIINYQVSNAVYNSATGDLILTSVGHGLTTGTIVGLATNSISLTCDRDDHATVHTYPRLTDPANNKSIAIGATTLNTFTLDVGESQSGDGGELVFNIVNSGSDYVNPRFDIDDPSYQDLPVTGASRLGVGVTTKVGIGLSMTFDATPRRGLPLTNKGGDAAVLIRKNRTLISEVAVGRMLDKYNPPNDHNYTGGTATNAVTINGTQKNVTGAEYTPETGLLVLTIGSHSFTTSHTATIAEESLKFKCALDNYTTEHKYPRSTDPAFETALEISAVSGTTVTVNVGVAKFTVASDLGGNYPHTFQSAAADTVNVQTGAQAGNAKTANGAEYDPETGVLILKFASAHGVSSGDTITLRNYGIGFKCAKNNYGPGQAYPRPQDPAWGATLTVTKITNTSFSVNVGAAGYNKQDCIDDVADVIDAVAYNVEYGGNDKIWDAANFYITGDHVAGEEKETVYAMREASSMAIQAMRNETIGVHSGAQYKHTFVSAGVGSITVGTGSTNIGIGTTTATSSTYDPITGLLVLTIPGHTYKGAVGKTATNVAYTPTSGITTITVANHGLSNGDLIKIVDESIVFTCAKDTHATEHKYPRSSDPASGTWYAISNKTANTFRVNVGAANDATVGVHTFVSASTAGILTAVNSIGIQTNSITFTCDRDENGTNATYPRTTDPFHNKIIAIASTTTNTLTVDVGISTHKYTTASQFKDETIRGDQTRTEGEYTVGDCALVASAINTLVGIVTIAIGSTQMPPKTPSSLNTFEISKHTIKKPGYSFERGDFFKPVGLVTAAGYVGERYKHKFVSSGVGSVVSGGGYTHTFISAKSDAVYTGGDYTHVFVGAAVSAVRANTWVGAALTPTAAVYTASNGNLKLTFAGRHNLKAGTDTVGIATNSLTFTCARDNYATEHAYPRLSDPIHNKTNIAIASTTLTQINIDVGLSARAVHAVSIGTYHPDTGELELLVGEGHSFKQASSHAITTAFYEPSTGILELGVTNHGFSKGEYIQIPDNSLRFTCAKDNHATFHTYPRTDVVSKDPTRGKWLPIDGVGVSTFRVNVGKANETVGLHSFFSASANLRYAVDAGIGTVGSIGIATESISFTCAKDDNATIHSYPRITDPIHGAVIGIGSTSRYAISVNVGVSSLVTYTPSGANYNPETGELVLITSSPHHLTTNNKVGILTGGLVFSCAKDGYTSDHAYPRVGFAHTFVSAGTGAMNITGGSSLTPTSVDYNSTTGDMMLTFASNHGLNTANTVTFEGYSLTFTCSKDNHTTQHSYPRPSDPIWAKTISIKKIPTNKKILVNVGKSNTGDPAHSAVLGITTYTTYTLSTNVGASPTPKPAKEIIFSVEDTFSDSYGSWQLGEFDYIDTVKDLQDGKRTRFPLYKNNQLLSFQKDEQDPIGKLIDLDAILLIYVNGVMQEPKVSYDFSGGTTFFFKEAPLADDKVDIFFYRGTRNVDSKEKDIKETIKPGDDLQILKHPNLPNTITQNPRIVADIAQSDLVETGIYLGDGINSIDYKPVNWIKQKRDILVNDNAVTKARDSLEPMVFPTSRIIADFSSLDTEIFVDNSQFFNYEENESDIDIQDVSGIILESVDPVSAKFTPVVSAAGSITSITINDGGSGYAPNTVVALDLSNPIGGIGNTVFQIADNLELVPARVGLGSTTISGISTVGLSTGMSIKAVGNGMDNRDGNNNPIIDWNAVFPSDVVIVGIRTEYTCFAGTCRTFGVVDIGTGWNPSGAAVTTAAGIGVTADMAISFGKYQKQVAAAATATVNASGIIVSTTVSNTGSGYTATNSLPYYKTGDAPEIIPPNPVIVDETLTKIRFVEGFSGIVTGITTANGIGHPTALAFHLAYNSTDKISDLKVGYPIHISETTVGHGVTSVNDVDLAVVGIGTTFADNIYKIHAISRNNLVGVITCNVHSGINTAGVHTMGGINEGKFSWGRLSGFTRSNAPIGLAVTGYVTNIGLTTFPIIQRRGYGLRDTGSLRKDLGI